jgi:hypothetical protein
MMKTFKIIATGLSATMLATTMLTGAAIAAPKPQVKVNVPKINMIKPVRPNIARPRFQVRVNKDRFEKKSGQDDLQADKLPSLGGQQRKRPAVAALTPPKRLPQPRPEFEEQAKGIKDMIGAEDIGDIDLDDLRVATNPHGSEGPLGDFGLPGNGEDEQQVAAGTSSPFGSMGGNDSMWNDPRANVDFAALNPVGPNSHSKDVPDTAPGVRVTPGSIAGAMAGVAGKGAGKDPEPDKQGDTVGSKQAPLRTPGERREYDSADGSSHIVETVHQEGSDIVIIRQIENAMGTNVLNRYMHEDGTRSDFFRFHSGWGWSQEFDAQGRPGPVRYYGIAELRDPDHAGGGGYVPPNCGSVECNESRKGKPGLRLSDGMVRALTDPEHSAAGPRNGAAPIVTQTDLLSQHDPDFNGGGGPTPIDKPRIQSD